MPSRLQEAHASAAGLTAAPSWPGATAQGSLLVAMVTHLDATRTVSAPGGWTEVTLPNVSSSSGTPRCHVFYILNAASRSGSESFTVSGAGTPSIVVSIEEWQINGGGKLDVSISGFSDVGGASIDSGTTAALADAAGSFAVALHTTTAGAADTVGNPNNSFTSTSLVQLHSGGVDTRQSEKIALTGSGESCSCSVSPNRKWAAAVVVFKPNAIPESVNVNLAVRVRRRRPSFFFLPIIVGLNPPFVTRIKTTLAAPQARQQTLRRRRTTYFLTDPIVPQQTTRAPDRIDVTLATRGFRIGRWKLRPPVLPLDFLPPPVRTAIQVTLAPRYPRERRRTFGVVRPPLVVNAPAPIITRVQVNLAHPLARRRTRSFLTPPELSVVPVNTGVQVHLAPTRRKPSPRVYSFLTKPTLTTAPTPPVNSTLSVHLAVPVPQRARRARSVLTPPVVINVPTFGIDIRLASKGFRKGHWKLGPPPVTASLGPPSVTPAQPPPPAPIVTRIQINMPNAQSRRTTDWRRQVLKWMTGPTVLNPAPPPASGLRVFLVPRSNPRRRLGRWNVRPPAVVNPIVQLPPPIKTTLVAVQTRTSLQRRPGRGVIRPPLVLTVPIPAPIRVVLVAARARLERVRRAPMWRVPGAAKGRFGGVVALQLNADLVMAAQPAMRTQVGLQLSAAQSMQAQMNATDKNRLALNIGMVMAFAPAPRMILDLRFTSASTMTTTAKLTKVGDVSATIDADWLALRHDLGLT